MEKNDIELALQELQAKLVNLKIAVAVPMGVLMILYFFTYATLIDMGMLGAFYVELFTTILFVLSLIYLHPLCFRLLRWRYSRHRRFGPLLALLTAAAMNRPAESLSAEIAPQLENV